MPPVTRICSPVRYLESSDARYTAVGAMSSVWPMRPSGDVDSTHLRKSPSLKPWDFTPSVSINPELIELTRILRGPNSFAKTPVIESTAALVAVYTEEFGGFRVLTPELTLMMLPPSGPISLTASLVASNKPKTLRLN